MAQVKADQRLLSTSQQQRLVALARDEEIDLRRLLRFYGWPSISRTPALFYGRLHAALTSEMTKLAMRSGDPLTDNHRSERRWHNDLDADDYHTAYWLSETTLDELCDELDQVYVDPRRCSLIVKELKHRLKGYRALQKAMEWESL